MNVNEVVDKIKNLWQKKEDGHKKMSAKEKWMLFFLIGLLVAVLFIPMEDKGTQASAIQQTGDEHVQNKQTASKTMRQYEEYLSEQLIHMLEQIDGAGKVDAWVTISESEERIFTLEGTEDITSLNEEDSAGGTRTEEKKSFNHTVITDKDGNPYVIKTMQPKVEGVFVVAEGAGNSVIKKNISEAVEVLFDIDAHRIKVAKKKLEE